MKMQVLRPLSAFYIPSGKYRSLVGGEIYVIESMQRGGAGNGTNFIIVDGNNKQLSVMHCSDNTFAILENDAKPSVPVFLKIKIKCNLRGKIVASGDDTVAARNTIFAVESVFPNNTDWQKNFSFVCKDSRDRIISMSNVARSMFSVLEGEGESLWDDDVVQL